MVKTKLLGLVFILFGASSIWAADKWHGSQIKWIYPVSSGTFILTFKTENSACPATGSPKYHHVTVGENGVTKEGADRIYALVLSAAAQKQVLNVNFSDSTAYCFINRAYVAYE